MLDGLKSLTDMRVAFVDTLIQCAQDNPNIWLLIGDVGYGLVEPFETRFPDRFVNMGVAEQNMVGVAAGLALSGKTVFCYSLGSFGTARCLEQIRNDVCYHNANVKIVAGGGGLVFSALGMTHHATEDIAIMRALPNMTVIAPCDAVETKLATKAIAESGKPCYLMLSRAGDTAIHQEIPIFEIGEAIVLQEGYYATLATCGGIIAEAVKAADILREDGLSVDVLSFHTIKPIDGEMVRQYGHRDRVFVTIEEHNLSGGFGSAVAEAIADMGLSCKLVRIGLMDKFCKEVGSQQYLRELNGLTAEHIAKRVKEAIL